MPTRFAPWLERARYKTLAFPLAALVAGLMITLSELAYHGADTRLTRLAAMDQARYELLRVLRRVTDAESGERGFLLTGGPEYLVPYQSARSDVFDGLQKIEKLYNEAGDTASDVHRKRITSLVIAKLSEMEETLRLDKSGARDTALEMVRTGIGRDQMEQLRKEVDELLKEQNLASREALTSVYDTLLMGRLGVAALTAVGLLVLSGFLRTGRLLDRQLAERQAEAQAERERLEREVRLRTADLTELARHLQTAREDERARLARDLHDELGALLTAAKLDVARIRPKLQQAAPDLAPRLAHLVEALNSGIALKRRIIEDLRPSTLSSLGLVPALEILCNESAERMGLPIVARLEPVRLAAGADLVVFRIVQESLTNIAKYARATKVEVTLATDGDDAVVEVRDNGAGFDTSQLSSRGSHGLLGMRFRVEAERGQLSVQSAPGRGTTLSARLPLAPVVEPAADGALDAASVSANEPRAPA
ncbi:MAG TPA: CHASE3 domain-containing protein [Ideonella sp.]|uniref:CHASE3 domain-containing protein n=1 Tax=Ideonella sp. TaxID=1929293 RepID=UPI002E377C1B|nr:CHASE3 domain-containing protein [Ideonella sp.]HEX5682981.1 CHASE3 domain-containing protein [Ideonella sp.]